jgi:WD40 repeat protein
VVAVAAVPLPDGRTLLATGSWDDTVRLWDVNTQMEARCCALGGIVHAIAFVDSDTIVVGLSDGVAVISLGFA